MVSRWMPTNPMPSVRAQPAAIPTKPPFPWLAVGAILIAVVVAYSNSLQGPFVFDDLPSITDNPTIRHLSTSLRPPPGGVTVSARPLVNLTLALNFALSADSVWSYHVVNIAIHSMAALTLFGLVRRTLRSPTLAARFGADADWLAGLVALLWAAHPLQTESVTYIVQRAESLAALFYLLTLYCFSRASQSTSPRGWLGASVLVCALGATAKETIATAPLLVLLYDRTFASGTFRAAWKRHAWYYGALATSWLVLGGLLLANGNRGGTAGFDVPIAWWVYALKQAKAIALYLKLSFWPHPLVFDYGGDLTVTSAQLAASLAIVLSLLAATIWALVRKPVVGYIGAWFFLALAPSSSVVPVATQAMAEHRMYLALAAIVALGLFGLYRWLGRRLLWIGAALGIACTARTIARNLDYRSPITLWTQALAYTENPRAHLNLGIELADANRPLEALAHYEAAAKIDPTDADASYNRGNILAELGRTDDAIAAYANALRLNPNLPQAFYNWANVLVVKHRPAEAVNYYLSALKLRPDYPQAHYNLANTLAELGRFPEAIDHYRQTLRLDPNHSDAHFNLGHALMQSNLPAEAVPEYEAVLRLSPNDTEAPRYLAAAREAAARR